MEEEGLAKIPDLRLAQIKFQLQDVDKFKVEVKSWRGQSWKKTNCWTLISAKKINSILFFFSHFFRHYQTVKTIMKINS